MLYTTRWMLIDLCIIGESGLVEDRVAKMEAAYLIRSRASRASF